VLVLQALKIITLILPQGAVFGIFYDS